MMPESTGPADAGGRVAPDAWRPAAAMSPHAVAAPHNRAALMTHASIQIVSTRPEITRVPCYLGFTRVLCDDTHCQRPSRITQTSVYRSVSSLFWPCLRPTTRSTNHTTAVSR